jgi:predicted RNase H-like HicB family nuclease
MPANHTPTASRPGLWARALRRYTTAGASKLRRAVTGRAEAARGREFHVVVREEDGQYWAEVQELPGCFASGRNLEELKEAVFEAITLYLSEDNGNPADQALSRAHVDEFRIAVPA